MSSHLYPCIINNVKIAKIDWLLAGINGSRPPKGPVVYNKSYSVDDINQCCVMSSSFETPFDFYLAKLWVKPQWLRILYSYRQLVIRQTQRCILVSRCQTVTRNLNLDWLSFPGCWKIGLCNFSVLFCSIFKSSKDETYLIQCICILLPLPKSLNCSIEFITHV